MTTKVHGQIRLASDITTTFPGPLDNRMIVNKVSDLIDADTWKVHNPSTAIDSTISYSGMLVVVKDDGANNGVYQYVGGGTTNLNSWVKYARTTDIPKALKGAWSPIASDTDITNYPEGGYAYLITGNGASSLGYDDGDIVYLNEDGTAILRVIKDISALNIPSTSDDLPEGVEHLYLTQAERDLLASLITGPVELDDITYTNPDPTDVQVGFIPAGYVFHEVTFKELLDLMFYNNPNNIYKLEAEGLFFTVGDDAPPLEVTAENGLIGGSRVPLNHYVEVLSINSVSFVENQPYPGTVSGGGTGGTFIITEDGAFKFSVANDFSYLSVGDTATVTLNYTLVDRNDANYSDSGVITVTVQGTNKVPVAPTVLPQTFDSTDTVAIAVGSLFTDPNGDSLTFTEESGTLPPYLSLDGNGDIVSIGSTPTTAHEDGPWNFVIRGTDPHGDYAEAVVNVTAMRPTLTTVDIPMLVGSMDVASVSSIYGILSMTTGKDLSGLAISEVNDVPFIGPSMSFSTPENVKGVLTVHDNGAISFDTNGEYDAMVDTDPPEFVNVTFRTVNAAGTISNLSSIQVTVTGDLHLPVISPPSFGPLTIIYTGGDPTIIGESVDFQLDTSFDKGSIYVDGNQTGRRTGLVTGYTVEAGDVNSTIAYSDTDVQNLPVSVTGSFVVAPGDQGISVQVHYLEGPVPKDSNNNPVGLPLSAGAMNLTSEFPGSSVWPMYVTSTPGSSSYTKTNVLEAVDAGTDDDGEYVTFVFGEKLEDDPAGFRGFKYPTVYGTVKGIKTYNPFYSKWDWDMGTPAGSLQYFTTNSYQEDLGGNLYDYKELIDDDVTAYYPGNQQLRIYFEIP